MATVNFLFRSTKPKANLTLRLLFRFKDNDFVFASKTKILTSLDLWEKARSNKKYKDPDTVNQIKDLNTELDKIENHVLTVFNTTDPETVNKEWLQQQVDFYYNPARKAETLPKEFLKYLDYFLTTKKNDLKQGTIKAFNVMKHLFERYEISRKTTVLLSEINDNFKDDFVEYCKGQKYAFSTITKHLKSIKWVCSHAKAKGMEISQQAEKIKTTFNAEKKLNDTPKIYLSFSEIEKIENIDKRRLNKNLETAKDWLIISCFTAQRVSDFMRFNKSMIRYETNKKGEQKPFIDFIQVKTDKLMTIALHPKVMAILSKRNGEFPKPQPDPKYNLYIKEVCRIAGINEMIEGKKITKGLKDVEGASYRKEKDVFKKWELVTSHIGRRSFCSNFYGTIPTSYLINISGHSSEAQFLNYLGKSNKDLAMETTYYF